MRGHQDDSTFESANKGNFIALLELLSKFDDELNHHLQFGRRNGRYTSKTIQNQLLVIVGNNIRTKVTASIKDDDTFFARDSGIPSIKEMFFDFRFLKKATGLLVSNAIKQSLESHGVDISKARGQAYDGASAMSSDICGVQAQIRTTAPVAVYTHCRSHVLNLSLAASCKIPEIRNMMDTINSLFLFFKLSPKRQRFLEVVLQIKGAPTRKRHLRGLCKTRWVEWHTCFDTFAEMYECLCVSLEAITFPDRHPDLLRVNPDDSES